MLVCKFSAASSCCDSIAAVEALASLGPESQKHSMSSASVSSEPAAAKALSSGEQPWHEMILRCPRYRTVQQQKLHQAVNNHGMK